MNRFLKGIVTTLVLLIVFFGLFAGMKLLPQVSLEKKIDSAHFNGAYIQPARPINKFSLTGTDGKLFNNHSLLGKWTLVFFGYTRCGYLCPTTMAELSKMYSILEKKGVKELPHIVMISIDPQRDDLEGLNHYVTAFHPSFNGATGEEQALKLMTKELGITYETIMSKDSINPSKDDIQHSGALVLFNPKGELNAFFTMPHHADSLAKDYMLLVS